MASTTLTALANAAALDIGVLDSGETLSAQQLSDALDLINKILDNWSSEQIQMPLPSNSIQSLVANNGSYTVGAASTWAINPAPVRITSASLIQANNVTLPVRVLTSAEWDQVEDRSSTSNLIKGLFYARSTFPGFGTVYVTPVPASNGASLWLQYWIAFVQFIDTTSTNNSIPAGYLKAMEWELARDLSQKFDVPWSQNNETSRQESMKRLRDLNTEMWGQIAAGLPAAA